MDSLIAGLIYVGIMSAKAIASLIYVLRFKQSDKISRTSDVTVMQPVLSGDPALPGVLEENVKKLSDATFLWLIDDDDMEGRAIVEKIAAQYPDTDIIVQVMPPPPEGVNPKLFKLEAAWRTVKTDVCLILDDDTRLPEQTLNLMVETLADVQIATALPFYRVEQPIFSKLLAQFVNNNSVLTYLSLPLFMPPVSINGMCYALKYDTLKRIGGFASLLNHLTDDLAVACHVKSNGGTIGQVPAYLEIETHVKSFANYRQLMHRWFLFAILLMRRQSVPVNITITLLHGLPPLLLWSVIILTFISPSAISVTALLTVLSIRMLTLTGLQQFITHKVRHNIILSIVSELLQPIHLIHAFLNRHIQWRTRKYRVYDNDHFNSQ